MFVNQEHECLVEGPLNNLKQSMVQFQKPKKVLVGFYMFFLSLMFVPQQNVSYCGSDVVLIFRIIGFADLQ